jgi:hypothetical protein
MPINLDAEIFDDPLPVEWVVARYEHETINIVRKSQGDGTYKFAVYDGIRRCLSQKGEWDFEGLPSGRANSWIRTHRFPSFEAAREAALPAARARVEELRERVRFINEKKSD